MKKLLSIFVAFFALCACESEDVISDNLTVCPEEYQTQISRSSGTGPLTNYSFINLMIGEEFGSFVPRRAFLKRDALYLLSRSKREKIYDFTRLRSMLGTKSLDEIEDEMDQKILELYEPEKLSKIKQVLTSYTCGDVTALNELTSISLSSEQYDHLNNTLIVIDDVLKPFDIHVLKGNFDSATTHKECYDAAVEAALRFGLDFAISTTLSLALPTKGLAIYYAIQLYKVYLDYDDCLNRVNGL